MVNFVIRAATAADIPALEGVVAAGGGAKEQGYFARCLKERDVFVAESGDEIAGYAQLNRNPLYAAFRAQGIPEIQDVNVAPDFRRQGLGAGLIAHCESVARAPVIGLGVGLHAGFGPAQRLYIKLGYVPDGAGAVYDEQPLRFAELRPLDDLLTLKMVKILA